MTDWQLIGKFTGQNSQAAFAEISRRYTNLVYCTCLRELGEPTLAEDAAQAVFLILARKASALRPTRGEATLSGWLFQTALLTSKNLRRQEQRRQAREQEAAQMPQLQPDSSREWADIEPLLNEALLALSAGQRALILERYFQDCPLAEIGAGRGLSEDAARMRVNRALDRLRRFFAARHVTLSVAALAALLPQAIRPAPAHAAEAIARLALPADGTSAFIIAQGAIHTMNTQRLKLQIGAAALVAAFSLGTLGAVQVTTQMKAKRVATARQENQAQALAVLNQMYATYAAMHSFKCSVTSREEPLHTAQDADYEIEYPNKVRFKRFTLLGGNLSGQATAVSDGSNLYVTCTEGSGQGANGLALNGLADRYAKLPVSNWLASFGGLAMWGTEPNAGMPFVALGERLEHNQNAQMSAPVYSLGEQIVLDLPGVPGPMPFDVVIAHIAYHPGVPGRDWNGAEELITYYIGQRDHLLYKLTASDPFSPTDLDTRTELINSIVNPKLPASDFVFTPPPGSHEVRDTSDLFPGGRG